MRRSLVLATLASRAVFVFLIFQVGGPPLLFGTFGAF